MGYEEDSDTQEIGIKWCGMKELVGYFNYGGRNVVNGFYWSNIVYRPGSLEIKKENILCWNWFQ